MLNRVRKIEDTEILLLNDGSFKLNKNFKYWNYEEVKSFLLSLKEIELKRTTIKENVNYIKYVN